MKQERQYVAINVKHRAGGNLVGVMAQMFIGLGEGDRTAYTTLATILALPSKGYN